jgi:septum site-determining protein MinD
MGRSISFASGKGGVGKTTATANIGIALAMAKYKVLLIDADTAMANLSLLMNLQNSPITLHEVLIGEANIEDAIYKGPKGVDVVPSGLSLDSYRKTDPQRLRSVVESMESEYGFILIDTPAGIESNVLAAIGAAKETMLITTPNAPGVAGALKVKLMSHRLQVQPIGVILNEIREEHGEVGKDEVSKVLEVPCYGRVPYDPEVRKSFLSKDALPIIVRRPSSAAASEFIKIAHKLGGRKVEIKKKEKKESFFSRFFGKLFGKKKGGKGE